MITHLLSRRTTRFNRGGFTLVELLVVIGIIAILAGVALGPITNGIRQAKHNAAMQQCRQLGQVSFSYATDNTTNGNAYATGATSSAVAQLLYTANYISDPSIFVVSGQTGISPAVAAGTAVTINATNCSYTFVAASISSGVTSNASDLIPLIYFNNGTTALATPFPATPGTAMSIGTLGVNAPFTTDGIAVFYKGNNAAYLKAGTGGTVGVVANFISANCQDTTAYIPLTP